jgi:hypothetical protein
MAGGCEVQYVFVKQAIDNICLFFFPPLPGNPLFFLGPFVLGYRRSYRCDKTITLLCPGGLLKRPGVCSLILRTRRGLDFRFPAT